MEFVLKIMDTEVVINEHTKNYHIAAELDDDMGTVENEIINHNGNYSIQDLYNFLNKYADYKLIFIVGNYNEFPIKQITMKKSSTIYLRNC